MARITYVRRSSHRRHDATISLSGTESCALDCSEIITGLLKYLFYIVGLLNVPNNWKGNRSYCAHFLGALRGFFLIDAHKKLI